MQQSGINWNELRGVEEGEDSLDLLVWEDVESDGYEQVSNCQSTRKPLRHGLGGVDVLLPPDSLTNIEMLSGESGVLDFEEVVDEDRERMMS